MVSVDGQRVAYLLGAAGACEGSTALHINKTVVTLHARGDFTSRSRVRAWRWPVAHTPNIFASLRWYSSSRRARGERSLRDASVRPSIHPSIHQSDRRSRGAFLTACPAATMVVLFGSRINGD
jgi:hypothetical protein